MDLKAASDILPCTIFPKARAAIIDFQYSTMVGQLLYEFDDAVFWMDNVSWVAPQLRGCRSFAERLLGGQW